MTSTTLVTEASQGGRGQETTLTVGVTPWRIFALVSGLLFTFASVRPISDRDLYWHLVLAKEMVARRSVGGLGLDWSFQAPDREWMTTQWLSELSFYWLHHSFGWQGISMLRVLTAVVFALLLARQLLAPRRTPWGSVVYLCVLLATFPVLQERPQLFSLLLLIWLSSALHGILHRGHSPAPWVVLVVTALWANLHGLWILVPAGLGLLLVGHVAGRDGQSARRGAVLVASALVGGCLTPVGPKLLVTPFEFASATAYVSEWQPTSFRNLVGVVFALLVGATAAAWARSCQPVPVTELVYVGGLVAFALLAMRNLPPAAILIAPVVVTRASTTFPRTDTVDGERERRALTAVACAVVAVAALVVGQRVTAVPPLPDTLPVALAEQISRQSGDHRVLNDYNIGGVLLFWGGPRTRVAVDGRADYYGVNYVRTHLELLALQGEWQRTLGRSRANYALLERDAPLVFELERRGWAVLGRDNGYVLLSIDDA